jgi:hypothetical protein
MLEPDWKQSRPDEAEIQDAWKQSVFSHVGFESPSLNELLRELRHSHSNGGAEFAMFSLHDDRALRWFLSRNRFDEIDYFEHLFCSTAFRSALPQLKSPSKLSSLDWEWSSPYLLDGDFARTLREGGAYEKSEITGVEAKQLGVRVCEELFGDRYDDIEVFKTYKPWSEWFHNLAWDITWVAMDKGKMKLWVLCLTDTD